MDEDLAPPTTDLLGSALIPWDELTEVDAASDDGQAGLIFDNRAKVAADVNGDGADDLVIVSIVDNAWVLRVRFGIAGFELREDTVYSWDLLPFGDVDIEFPLSPSFFGGLDRRVYPIDYNHDGLDDILYVDFYGKLQLLTSNGTSFIPSDLGVDFPTHWEVAEGTADYSFQGIQIADLNGDGLTDLTACLVTGYANPHFSDFRSVFKVGRLLTLFRNPADGFFPERDVGVETSCAHQLRDTGVNRGGIGEFTGDGVADLLVASQFGTVDSVPNPAPSHDYLRVAWFYPETDSFNVEESGVHMFWHNFEIVDLNGDGISDVAAFASGVDNLFGFKGQNYFTGDGGDTVHLDQPFDHAGRIYWRRPFGWLNAHGNVLDTFPLDLEGDGRGELMLETLPPGEDRPFDTIGLYPHAVGWLGTETRILREFATAATPTALTTRGWLEESRSVGCGGEFPCPVVVPTHTWRKLPLDGNGDGVIDVLQMSDTARIAELYAPFNGLQYVENKVGQPALIARVTNGYGEVQEADYSTVADTSSHACSYPQRCVTDSRYHVERLTHGSAGSSTTPQAWTYAYEDPRVDLQGRGWLGFAKVTRTNVVTGELTTTQFDNITRDAATGAYPFAGLPTEVTTERRDHAAGDIGGYPSLRYLATKQTYEHRLFAAAGTFWVRTESTTMAEYEAMSAAVPIATLSPLRVRMDKQTYDDYGNMLTQTTDYGSGYVDTLVRAVDNDPVNWIVGRVDYVIATTESPACREPFGPELRAEYLLSYEPDTKLLRTTTRFPFDSSLKRTTTLTRDPVGNVTSFTEAAAGEPSRTTVLTYDGTQSYPAVATNALGHPLTVEMHDGLGVVTASTDQNGLVTEYAYDIFRRLRMSQGPDGNVTEVRFESRPDNHSATVIDTTGGATRDIERDAEGRVHQVRQESSFGATAVRYDYDLAGRVYRVSRPFFASAINPTHWTRYFYDGVGVLREVQSPKSGVKRHQWREPGVSHRTDFAGARYQREVDAHGFVSRETSPGGGGTTSYEYCGTGAIRRIVDAQANVTTVDYDALGRRTGLHDPDAGTQYFGYSGFDQLAWVRDAVGELVSFGYDRLGRQTTRSSSDDIVHEAAALSRASGSEVGVLSLQSGERVMVSGGPAGIDLRGLSVRRLLGHTHPGGYPDPSPGDLATLRLYGQRSSYLLEVGENGGFVLSRFGR